MEKIERYLKFYLGQKVRYFFLNNGFVDEVMIGLDEDWAYSANRKMYKPDIKPILRPLSDMKENERQTYHSLNTTRDNKEQCEANCTVWLCQNGFDLFKLIDTGFAIDATKLQSVV